MIVSTKQLHLLILCTFSGFDELRFGDYLGFGKMGGHR